VSLKVLPFSKRRTVIIKVVFEFFLGSILLFFGYKEILRQHPPEAHTTRAEAPWRATQRERL
jgi:hypothetical protein